MRQWSHKWKSNIEIFVNDRFMLRRMQFTPKVFQLKFCILSQKSSM